MKMQKTVMQLLFLAATFLVTLQPTPTIGSPSTNDSDFIRTFCKSTLYFDVCYATFSPLAPALKNDLGRLSLKSIDISLTKTKPVVDYLNKLKNNASLSGSEAGAVSACADQMADAVDNMVDSMKELQKWVSGGRSGGSDFQSMINDVRTGMSAVSTDADTCKDGFDDLRVIGPVKDDVLGKVNAVNQFYSISLAFLARYGETGKH